MAARSVVIDFLPESAAAHRDDRAIVAIDVIRATTTAVTGVELGRRCFPAATIEEAVPLAARLDNPLLVGEVGGNMPYGFDLTNSPAQLAQLADVSRPMILLSTSGTLLIGASRGAEAIYAACLRNVHAQASQLVRAHDRVALIGAGARGEFREEDQLCCAWIGELLVEAGYEPADAQTTEVIERWRGADAGAIEVSNSVTYLRDTGQLADLEFVLGHVDDLGSVFAVDGEEIVRLDSER
ncbi:MAG: 2-phosphosulfolactate phosphatase [Gaiellaceae bacterium]|nr:2-phosphosulfolactate phosphatase [Gaiellaceae bacterium]MDX6441374.1 2-phosphosulfolactate phosphatase [Gaiellaceae bacterium]